MPDQQKYTQKFKDAKVLIIGGSAGIGYGVAEGVLEQGGYATISSSNPTRVEAAIKRLQTAYPSAASRVSGSACDLSKQETLEQNIKGLFERTGKVDHVVYTAGDALGVVPLKDLSVDQIIQMGMVRFFGPLMVGKISPGYLTGGPTSSITFSSGSIAENPMPNWTAVASFASGMYGMTRNMAVDLAPVRVNVVAPGPVDTELFDSFSREQKEAFVKSMEERALTGRMGQVEDVAEAYMYCLRDRNLTGVVISSHSGGSLGK